jgi:hypothetical protein
MAHDPVHILPIAPPTPEQVAAEAHAAQPRLATQEQLAASDQLFAARQEQEHQAVASLLGLYTGTLLLRDLMAEHLAHGEEEEEERKAREKPVDR